MQMEINKMILSMKINKTFQIELFVNYHIMYQLRTLKLRVEEFYNTIADYNNYKRMKR